MPGELPFGGTEVEEAMEIEKVETNSKGNPVKKKGLFGRTKKEEDDSNTDEASENKEKKEKDPPAPCVSYLELYKYADKLDYVYIFLGTFGAIINGVALPVFFVFLGKLLDSFGTLYQQSPEKSSKEVAKYALDFVYLALIVLGAAYTEVAFWMQTGERQSARVRSMYLRSILRQDVGYFDVESSTADVVGRVSTDTLLFQDAIGEKVGNFIHNMATFIGGFAVGFSQVWQLTLCMAAFIPVLAIPGILYARILTGLSSKESAAYSQAGNVAEQAISSVRTIYSFVGEKKTLDEYSVNLQKSLKMGISQGLAKGMALGANGLMFCMWAFMFWFGGELVIKGEATGGKILGTAFSVIIGGVALGQAMPNIKSFAIGRVAGYRIFKMIDRIPAIDNDDENGQILENVEGRIELRHLSFSYPSRPDVQIFNDFSLEVPGGKTVALVGASGSGKSTVIALLERFYDPSSGEILIDGFNIKSLQLKWLRKQIGLVSQEPALFATTIRQNILYGKEGASDEEVENAAKSANAYNFIMSLPNKFETQVGERGVQMSGGQKQRIAIARSILKNPPILLLDEATSALDSESERIVQTALDNASLGRTTVIIAHRLSTVRNADSISVVQNGKIIEKGSHDELIGKDDGAYNALVNLQNNRNGGEGEGEENLETETETASKRTRTLEGGELKSKKPAVSMQASALSQLSEGQSAGEGEGEKEKVNKPSFGRLLAMNKPEWPYAFLGIFGSAGAGAVNPIWALIVAGMINVYFSVDHGYIRDSARKYSLIFIAVGVASFIANCTAHFFFGIVGEYLTKRVREKMLSTILRQEIGFFDEDKNSSGALTTKLSSDAQLVRALVGDRVSLIIQSIAAVGLSTIIGLVLIWKLALVILATLPLVILSFLVQNLMLKGFSSEQAKAQEDASQVAGEAVSQHRTVTAFSSQDRVLALFNSKLEGPQKKSWLRSQIAGVGLGLGQFILYTSWGLALWYGAQLSKNEGYSFDHVFKVFLVIISTGFGVAEAMAVAPDFAKGGKAVESVFSILDRKPGIDSDEPGSRQVDKLDGLIELKDVNFFYPSRPDVVIFDGFCLKINAGTTVALVGQSGSGKSTIIGLIERFYDPISGRITIDGIDIKKYNLKSLRKNIGLVQQEPVLFATSIRENILYGNENATESEIIKAATTANAHNFISSLPEGYETFCGERGVQLSGGQKQRIAIARAVLKDPAILLLDEATSALDAESERVVQEALDRLMQNRTTVVVAHRLSTIRNADTIAVLQEGKIVEQGNHETLMGKGEGGSYYSLVKLQSHG